MIQQRAKTDEGGTSGDVTEGFPFGARTPIVVTVEVVIVAVAFVIVVAAVPGLFLHELLDESFELRDFGLRVLFGSRILGGFLGCFGLLGVLLRNV